MTPTLLQKRQRLVRIAGVDIDGDHLELRRRRARARSASSAGISLRQGTHQVAHRLRSTVRPRQSVSVRSRPSRILEGEIGHQERRAARRSSAATSPCASGAMRLAVATAGAQAAAAGLLRRRAIPYTPASTARIAAPPPADAVTRRRAELVWTARRMARSSTIKPRRTFMSMHHEQQNVGRTLRFRVPIRSWRRSTPRSISTATSTGRTSPRARPMRQCLAKTGHHLGAGCKDASLTV